MKIFNKLSEKAIDKSKPTAAFLVYENNQKFDYIFGFTKIIMKTLAETHNIIIIGKDEIGDYESLGTFYNFNAKRHSDMKDSVFLRSDDLDSDEDPNWIQNRTLLMNEFESCFGTELDGISKIIICHDVPFQLSLTNYVGTKVHPFFLNRFNDYFDYVGDDSEIIEKINITNSKVVKEFDRRTSIIAFTTFFKNVYNSILDFIVERNSDIFKRVYGFIIDPAFFTPYFVEKNIPFTAYYFANDTRGTRDFKYFPIGQLQHIIYDDYKEKSKPVNLFETFSSKSIEEKTKDFFFAGTVLQEKGSRVSTWKDFIKDLRLENSDIFVPLKANGIYYNQKENTRNTNVALKKFPELYEEVRTHPMYSGHVPPSEYVSMIKKYKYGLILRCVSLNDSLNFRPILYAKHNILPLIDELYDPFFLQIPERIQKQLIVKNHKDIEEKVNFFNENPSLRDELLKELRDIFEVDTFKKTYQESIKTYFE